MERVRALLEVGVALVVEHGPQCGIGAFPAVGRVDENVENGGHPEVGRELKNQREDEPRELLVLIYAGIDVAADLRAFEHERDNASCTA